MGRPIEFRREDVLYSALVVFWERGYESTSLPDLLKATGLSKSSLYSTFGSKRDLFIEAFDCYRQERVVEMNALLGEGNGRSAIAAFFSKVVCDATSQKFRRGCMSTNQAVELALSDPDIKERVCSDFSAIENALSFAVSRGKIDSSIASDQDASILAEQLTLTFAGIQVLVRAGVSGEKLKNLANSLLAILD